MVWFSCAINFYSSISYVDICLWRLKQQTERDLRRLREEQQTFGKQMSHSAWHPFNPALPKIHTVRLLFHWRYLIQRSNFESFFYWSSAVIFRPTIDWPIRFENNSKLNHQPPFRVNSLQQSEEKNLRIFGEVRTQLVENTHWTLKHHSLASEVWCQNRSESVECVTLHILYLIIPVRTKTL